MTKKESLNRLGAILAEMFEAQFNGATADRLFMAKGLADGYMRALSDFDIVPQGELLEYVNQQRLDAANRASSRVYRATEMQEAVDFA